MFTNTESEVARFREILFPQFVFLDFETTLEDFLSLGTADGDVDGDFFVTSDTKGTDCVAGFAYIGQYRSEKKSYLEHVSGVGGPG